MKKEALTSLFSLVKGIKIRQEGVIQQMHRITVIHFSVAVEVTILIHRIKIKNGMIVFLSALTAFIACNLCMM